MPHRRSTADGRGGKIDPSDVCAIALGETFHKAATPWILWSVARINPDTRPAHVELTMRRDPTTRITVSVDALTNDRYFRRVGAETR
jgi:hypothetical protein